MGKSFPATSHRLRQPTGGQPPGPPARRGDDRSSAFAEKSGASPRCRHNFSVADSARGGAAAETGITKMDLQCGISSYSR